MEDEDPKKWSRLLRTPTEEDLKMEEQRREIKWYKCRAGFFNQKSKNSSQILCHFITALRHSLCLNSFIVMP